jgi:hypothetical protein
LPKALGVIATTLGNRFSASASSSDSGRALLGKPDMRAAAGLGLARMHANHIGAELGEFAQHIAMDALANRGQQDHRCDADGDAEQRQEAPQALGDDGADGEGEEVGDAHVSASSTPAPDRA